MPVKDIRSHLQTLIANVIAISGNGTTNGVAIDTSEFESGIMLTPSVSVLVDGTYNFTIEESVDAAFTVPIAIIDGSDKLIGTIAALVLAAASVNGSILPSIGLISTKKFVRINVVASAVTTGATVVVLATQKSDYQPVV